jgi:excisionase family DNA binding protein
MSIADDTYMTIPDVAARLEMTPDGVYKLIQRGHLPSVRLSARKLRVPAAALHAYLEREAIESKALRGPEQSADPAKLRAEFINHTGSSPEDWLDAWKRDELEDTPENMAFLVRAVALRGAAANVPLSHPAVASWARAAFGSSSR